MSHKLLTLIDDIDETHPRLGRSIAMAAIAVKARQFLLIVAPSGCGKSAIEHVIKQSSQDVLNILSITTAKLADYAPELTSSQKIVLLDDVSAIPSEYERRDTIMIFSMLCHEHNFNKHTMIADYEIIDFQGSAVFNIQPVRLAELYASPEWEGLLQDKSFRLYHLFRPHKPQMLPPQVKIDWGIDLEKVKSKEFSGEIYDRLLKIAQVEWSDARALQHLTTLIRATAALDRREEVKEDDLKLLDMLMRPMILERYLFTKSGFESGRVLDVNLAALIVEFASWKRLDIERIVRDYKVSPTTAYRLVKNLNGWVEHTKTGMKASKELVKILEEIGVKLDG